MAKTCAEEKDNWAFLAAALSHYLLCGNRSAI